MLRDDCARNYPIRLVLSTPFVRSYRYVFPNSEAVNIKIAYFRTNCGVTSLSRELAGSVIHIQEILNLELSLQFIAIRTRINQLGIGQSIDGNILNGFNSVIVQSSSGKLFLVYCNQNTSSLSSFVSSNKPQQGLKKLIINEYKYIMNDLAEHHIVLTKAFDIKCLRVNPKNNKPVIRVNSAFTVGHLYKIDSSHEQEINIFKQEIESALNTQEEHQLEKELYAQQQKEQVLDQIISFISFLQQLTFKPFAQIEKQAQYNHMLDDSIFIHNLYEHLRVEGQTQSLIQLVNYRQFELASTSKKKPSKIEQLDRWLQLRFDLQLGEKKMPASKTNAECLKKLYYNPLHLYMDRQRSHYSVTQQDINKVINNIKPMNSFNKCKFHFLKGKQAWIDLQFYRAVAHYKKAQTFAKSDKVKSAIYLELGRIWSHLCDFSKAQNYYLDALRLRQRNEGSESIGCLSILENLTMIYGRMYRTQKVQQLQQRCQAIKKRYNNKHLRLMPNLIYSLPNQIVSYFENADSPSKSKPISKEDMLKMQLERIPALAKMWQIIKNSCPEKNEKHDAKLLGQNQHLFQFGEFNQIYCLLKLLSSFHTNLPLTPSERARVLKAIAEAKQTNLRMYYRLIFMMAQQYQRRNQNKFAIQSLNILIQSRIFPFTQINAFKKQVLALAKKDNITAQIRQIYSDSDWLIKEAMLDQLHDSAFFFFSQGNFLQSMSICDKFLKEVSKMQWQHQGRKVIKNPDRIMKLLTKCYIQLHLFPEAWNQITQIKQTANLQDFNTLLILFCVEAYNDKQYSYCVDAFSLISIQPLLQQPENKRKEIWCSVVRSLLIQNAQITQSYKLVSLWKSISNKYYQIDDTSLLRQISQQCSTKHSWKDLISLLSIGQIQAKTTNFAYLFEDLQRICSSSIQSKSVTNIKSRLASLTQSQLEQSIQFIADLINRQVQLRGYSSQQIFFLHTLLFQAASLIPSSEIQVYILLWASSHGVWSQQLCGSKRERQQKLDQLLLHLFSHQMSEILVLSKLWWYQSKKRDLIKLRNLYLKIKECDIPQEIIYGSYISLEPTESFLCKGILNKLMDYQQDEI